MPEYLLFLVPKEQFTASRIPHGALYVHLRLDDPVNLDAWHVTLDTAKLTFVELLRRTQTPGVPLVAPTQPCQCPDVPGEC